MGTGSPPHAATGRALGWSLSLAGGLLAAAGGMIWAAPAQATCSPGQRPCIDNVYMDGPTTLVFTWRGGQHIGDVPFQVRYRDLAAPGFLGGDIPIDNQFGVDWLDESKWTIMNVIPGSTYLLKVQGCTSRGFAIGSCDEWSEWDEKTFTVPSPEPPPTRKLGKNPIQDDSSRLDQTIDIPNYVDPVPSTTATVAADVDLYNAKNEPDGAGQVVGILRQGNTVSLSGTCAPESWCEVSGDAVPGHQGWVWGHLILP